MLAKLNEFSWPQLFCLRSDNKLVIKFDFSGCWMSRRVANRESVCLRAKNRYTNCIQSNWHQEVEQLRSLSLSTCIGQDETDCCKLFTLPSAKSWGSPWRYVEPLERQVSLMASHDRYIRERRTTTHNPTHHHIRLISIVSICLLLRYPRVKYEIYFCLHPSQNH